MKAKVGFIADFFDILGGAEKNDNVLIDHLSEKFEVVKIQSHLCTISKVDKCGTLIVSNFVNLSEEVKSYISENKKYIIYEHDHKYVKSRDPSKYPKFKIPNHQLVNVAFYKRASSVVVLSKICKEILLDNIPLKKVYNIGTSLWSSQKLEKIESFLKSEKKIKCGVLNSHNPIKGKNAALAWCREHNIVPELISSDSEEEFLKILSKCQKLVFVPQVLETFSRLVAEAKMLDCAIVTNRSLLGFASEDSFELSGRKLIEETKKRVKKALNLFSNLIESNIECKEGNISAVLLVWKRIESTKILVDQVSRIQHIDEIILWNNNQDFSYTQDMFPGVKNITIVNSHINKITFGRYLGAYLAKNQHVFVQDDDWNIKDFEFIYEKYKKTKSNIVAVCPSSHMQDLERNKFVGWGSIFNKKALGVFRKYISIYSEDELLYREADLLFTNCNSYEKHETIPHSLVADDVRSLSLSVDHFKYHYNMLQRVKEIKKLIKL
tara:strand:- start:19618 stop:21099 length:1482 start_codon:yes stop_codon:yes gene_type:complete